MLAYRSMDHIAQSHCLKSRCFLREHSVELHCRGKGNHLIRALSHKHAHTLEKMQPDKKKSSTPFFASSLVRTRRSGSSGAEPTHATIYAFSWHFSSLKILNGRAPYATQNRPKSKLKIFVCIDSDSRCVYPRPSWVFFIPGACSNFVFIQK